MSPSPPRAVAFAFAALGAAVFLLPTRVRGDASDSSGQGHTAVPAGTDPVNNSVVKVFATLRLPDVYHPWAKRPPQEVTGSGVVIEGRRILTCARVVSYASQVQIQTDQAGDKISGTVEYLAPGMDLAVLKLDDETFFDTHPPLPRAEALPQIQDAVTVYGFPIGGGGLSITKGIVSRIEFVRYFLRRTGLRIQVDAAINPGNSGGPAIVANKMVGLAFNRLGGNTEEIGYIIPNEEIDLFLHGLASGKVDNKPALFEQWQGLQNPALRSYLNLPATVHGVVIHEPYDLSPSYALKPLDILTAIGNKPIDDEGMILTGHDLRISYLYEIQHVAKNWKVPLAVIRKGRRFVVNVPLVPEKPRLIKFLTGGYPPYFIYGPVPFSVATEEYVSAVDSNNRANRIFAEDSSPLVTRMGDKPAFPGEELVIIPSPFFPNKLIKGYSNHSGWVVKSVNDVRVRNLRHLVELLRDCRDRYVRIDFWGEYTSMLIFERAQIQGATDDVLNDNGIRSQGSPDMMAVWNSRPAP